MYSNSGLLSASENSSAEPFELNNVLLDPAYNFIIFFSFPFYPDLKAYKKTYSLHGHLSVCLGRTVYQLHDPKKLKSRFLVSRMPLETWLYEDGCWHDWDPGSDKYRHVHLYERAEVKRTHIYYLSLKGFSLTKQRYYETYFEETERSFQRGQYRFNLLFNNCSHAITSMLYKEGWLKKRYRDFLPVVVLQRLAAAWHKSGCEFTSGVLFEQCQPQFKLHPVCLGLFTLSPQYALAERLSRLATLPKK